MNLGEEEYIDSYFFLIIVGNFQNKDGKNVVAGYNKHFKEQEFSERIL